MKYASNRRKTCIADSDVPAINCISQFIHLNCCKLGLLTSNF